MQINNMLPLLIGILTGQSGQGKVGKAPPRQGTDGPAKQGVEQAAVASSSRAASSREAAGIGEKDVQAVRRQASPGQILPDFLPLPLKSPLFEESAFFVKNSREESPGTGEEGRPPVFIRLRTENLGVVWISLAAVADTLNASFYTEGDNYTSFIKESFPDLSGELEKLGFSRVNLSGITRPGIRDCSDIAPGSAGPGLYLLDLEV